MPIRRCAPRMTRCKADLQIATSSNPRNLRPAPASRSAQLSPADGFFHRPGISRPQFGHAPPLRMFSNHAVPAAANQSPATRAIRVGGCRKECCLRRRNASPASRAMARARCRVSGGVRGLSRSLKSGWNAVKCNGTSGPRWSKIQSASRRVSSGSSFRVGIIRLVISNQTLVSFFSHCSISSTGCKCVSVMRP